MMTMKCKYAIKALVVLADEHEKLSSRVIAKKAKVPIKFLEAILTDLKKAGILKSERGAHGGHTLKKEPDQIVLGQVIRAIDGMIAPIPCASTFYYKKCRDCAHEDFCVIRHAMQDVRNKTATYLDNTTLADMINWSPRKKQHMFW